jgi:hypothetical protein
MAFSSKYFKMQNMKKEVLLLEYMIGLCGTLQSKGFQIGTQLLTIDLEDVYFLTDLSKRGAPIVLSGQRVLPVHVDEYMENHCVPGSRLVGGRIVHQRHEGYTPSIHFIFHYEYSGKYQLALSVNITGGLWFIVSRANTI